MILAEIRVYKNRLIRWVQSQLTILQDHFISWVKLQLKSFDKMSQITINQSADESITINDSIRSFDKMS